jgi:hypothetical protein
LWRKFNLTDIYDKSKKGSWQLINGTLQWQASETPIIDSLLNSDTDKPVRRSRLDRPTSLTDMSGGVIKTVDNRGEFKE